MFSRPFPSTITRSKGDARIWQRFSLNIPPDNALIEIRREHDDKTILRRRSDLPPTFAYETAEWRAPL